MKQGTLDHPKNLKLARILNLEPWQSLGLLDAFVNFVAQYAPDGDLLGLASCDISEQMRYKGDPTKMMKAIKDAGFIDQKGRKRIVHDWPDHAPEYIKKRVMRGQMKWACLDMSVSQTDLVQTSPDESRHDQTSRAGANLALSQPSPAQSRQHTPSLPPLSQKTPVRAPKPKTPRNGVDYKKLWEWVERVYPVSVFEPDSQLLISLIETAADESLLRTNLPLWTKTRQWSERGAVPAFSKFISEKRWKTSPKEVEPMDPLAAKMRGL